MSFEEEYAKKFTKLRVEEEGFDGNCWGAVQGPTKKGSGRHRDLVMRRKHIADLMAEPGATYRKVGDALGLSQQNVRYNFLAMQ